MEETDKLEPVATATASNENPNPELTTGNKPSSVREEGELSSSDTEINANAHVRSASQEQNICSSATAILAAPPTGLASVPSAKKFTQGIQAGKAVSGDNPLSSVDGQPRTSIQPAYKKTIVKHQGPAKTMHRWSAPNVANENLVIHFSDGESGSDSEDKQKVNALRPRVNTFSNGRPLILLPEKSNKMPLGSRLGNKVMPNASLNRTTIPSMNKSHRVNSRVAMPSLDDPGSKVRNSNTLGKNLSSRERGYDQLGLDISKVQDLRELIALRESKLKQKPVQQKKELISASCRDDHVSNSNEDMGKKGSVPSSSGLEPCEPKGPDKKRLKASGSYSTMLSSGSSGGPRILPAEKTTKLILQSKEPGMESGVLCDTRKVDQYQKGILMGRSDSSAVKWNKLVGIPLENIPRGVQAGTDIITNFNQSGNVRRLEPLAHLDRAGFLPNIRSSFVQEKINSKELNHHGKSDRNQPSAFISKTKTTAQNLTRSIPCNDKATEPSNVCQASIIGRNLWSSVSKSGLAGNSQIDIQSLLEMEESLDKDLEEAQEHRCKCEAEERTAFKAYRMAQRAMVEANARCVDLYRKRELYSAHIQSFIMENSSLIFSSRTHEDMETDGKFFNMPDNVNLQSTDQIQPDYIDGFNQHHNDSNFDHTHTAPTNTLYQNRNGQILESEPSCEPEGNTSEQLPWNGKNAPVGVCFPFSDSIMSADEDEEPFPYHRESTEPNLGCHIQEKKIGDKPKDINNEPRMYSSNSAEDSLHLEAKLRSELFTKFGTKKLPGNSGLCYGMELSVERGNGNHDRSQRSRPKNIEPAEDRGNGNDTNITISYAKEHLFNNVSTGFPESNISNSPFEIQNGCHFSPDSDDNAFFTREGHHLTSDVWSTSLMSAFHHLKSIPQVSSEVLGDGDQQRIYYHVCNEEASIMNDDGKWWSKLTSNFVHDPIRDFGSYTCNPVLDPFWPLCMYELRGKCNNDKCHWQHIKDYSTEHMHQKQPRRNNCFGHQKKFNGATKLPNHQYFMTPPTYLVGLEAIKVEPHLYESILARRSHGWLKCLSISLTLSSLLQKLLPADGPFLHDGRIEAEGSYSRFSYFQSRKGKLYQPTQSLDDNDQTLEMALLVLNQETNKLEGFKKALPLLSRALEADPTSLVLWIVFLLIYNHSTKMIGKDDMFSHAVKHNKQAYELWLLFINSRKTLDDRLSAYNMALSAICDHAPAFEGSGIHRSACILDLFLQMVDCWCMSGNVDKAIQRVFGLVDAESDSHDSYSLSDILTRLTFSDKCIFWVCCLYLVIYRKLSDAVLQQFECEKVLVEIEWHAIPLVDDDEKQRAFWLVEMAVHSVDSSLSTEIPKSTINLRSAQVFSINHIKCLLSFGSLEDSRNLLDKYLKLYPSCLELVLLSACTKKHDSGDDNFVGFEEALSTWPNGAPGLQCIWNQYAEYALQNGKIEYAKKLMARWFDCVWKAGYLQSGALDSIHGETSNTDMSNFDPNQTDIMFGYLNLSLLRVLENDHFQARSAMDNALKIASPENFKHCMREYAAFLLTDESLLKEVASVGGMRSILEGYLNDTRAFPVAEPLPRKFINSIKKPRVRQLVSNILSPVSPDCSLVNAVLEVWFGQSLLPHNFKKQKDLVDFVETVLEILPSNYQLAICVCKQLSRLHSSSGVPSASLLFWASSNLVSAIFQAIPLPPEYIWVEAAHILDNGMGIQAITQRFCRQALSVYPFSVRLWKSYYNLCQTTGDASTVLKEAREKGIELG